jgi:redox-sensing transcriptional repressor
MKTADHKISEFTIYRLSIYKRCLEQLERERIPTISSKDFAIRFGLNSAQVRKDLAYFGEFGIRGMGYPVKTLKEQILNILGLAESSLGKKTWKAIVIGAGKLGMAILQYKDFRKYGFEILAVLDADPQTSEYTIRQQADVLQTSVPLSPIDQLETVIEEHDIDIAILAIPEDNAQEIADRLVNAGIRAILNFVPIQLLVPSHVKVRTVDIVAELQSLTYHLNKVKNEED